MKFMKGVMWGVVITAGAYMLMNETSMGESNKWMKKGKKMMKKCGMI